MLEKLTERERDVLKLIAKGYKNQAIADDLSLAASTVGNCISKIMAKLNVSSRYELIIRFGRD